MRTVLLALLVFLAASTAEAAWDDVDRRLDALAAEGKPLVVHVVVALADNVHQGIVPVPKAIGNGQDARSNLYWGARYGVATFLPRDAGWTRVRVTASPPEHVLERLVLKKELTRGARRVTAWVVADAWDGKYIRPATERFLDFAAGRSPESIPVGDATLDAGGAAPIVAYVGHDGLMDFEVAPPAAPAPDARPRAAIVLACISRSYFGPHLARTGAHRALLTTGLLAPEAYVLDAALSELLVGKTPADARESAARAYDRFQKCGMRGARRLFAAE